MSLASERYVCTPPCYTKHLFFLGTGTLQVRKMAELFKHYVKPPTVVRAHGLRLMWPEKKWRPIIRMEIDTHHIYETVLGCDGQNVDATKTFSL